MSGRETEEPLAKRPRISLSPKSESSGTAQIKANSSRQQIQLTTMAMAVDKESVQKATKKEKLVNEVDNATASTKTNVASTSTGVIPTASLEPKSTAAHIEYDETIKELKDAVALLQRAYSDALDYSQECKTRVENAQKAVTLHNTQEAKNTLVEATQERTQAQRRVDNAKREWKKAKDALEVRKQTKPTVLSQHTQAQEWQSKIVAVLNDPLALFGVLKDFTLDCVPDLFRTEEKWGSYGHTDRLANFAVLEDGESYGLDMLHQVRKFIIESEDRYAASEKETGSARTVGSVLSAPGGGKSHFLDMICEQLSGHTLEHLLNSLPENERATVTPGHPKTNKVVQVLKVTFNGQMPTTDTTQHTMSTRVLFSFFCGLPLGQAEQFRNLETVAQHAFPTEVSEARGGPTLPLSAVLGAIEAHLENVLGKRDADVPQAVRTILLIDEIGKATDLAKSICTGAMRACDLRDRLMIVTSLDIVPLDDVFKTKSSNRDIVWFPLCRAPVTALTNIDDLAAPLYAMTLGHWRSVEVVRGVLDGAQKPLTEELVGHALQIIGRKLARKQKLEPADVRAWSFSVVVQCQHRWLDTTNKPTLFAKSVGIFKLLNSLVYNELAVDVPRLSLFCSQAMIEGCPPLAELSMRLSKPWCAKSFEMASAVHSFLLLERHAAARNAPADSNLSESPDPLRLFNTETKPLPAKPPLNKAQRDASGPRNLYSGVILAHQATDVSLNELFVNFDSKPTLFVLDQTCDLWTAGDWPLGDDTLFLCQQRKATVQEAKAAVAVSGPPTASCSPDIQSLTPNTVMFPQKTNQSGFDYGITLKVTDISGSSQPLFVGVENKYSERPGENLEKAEIKQKIKTFNVGLRTMLELGNKHVLYRYGITDAKRATLFFVCLRGVRSTLQSSVNEGLADEAKRGRPVGFNIVVMDEEALHKHFGPSLEPAVALFQRFAATARENAESE